MGGRGLLLHPNPGFVETLGGRKKRGREGWKEKRVKRRGVTGKSFEGRGEGEIGRGVIGS